MHIVESAKGCEWRKRGRPQGQAYFRTAHLPLQKTQYFASGPPLGTSQERGRSPEVGWRTLGPARCACALPQRTCSSPKCPLELEFPRDGNRHGVAERGDRGWLHPSHRQGWPAVEEAAGWAAVRGGGGRWRGQHGHGGGPAREEARFPAPLRRRIPGNGGDHGTRAGQGPESDLAGGLWVMLKLRGFLFSERCRKVILVNEG